MSIHGTCYDNGQSGKCNEECEVFKDGDCECHDDVMNAHTPTGTSDADHLEWVFERLYHVYEENPALDYMQRLRKIIIKLRSQNNDRIKRSERQVREPKHRTSILRSKRR